jgi:hypothetical protein
VGGLSKTKIIGVVKVEIKKNESFRILGKKTEKRVSQIAVKAFVAKWGRKNEKNM